MVILSELYLKFKLHYGLISIFDFLLSSSYMDFHQLGPLGRVGHRRTSKLHYRFKSYKTFYNFFYQ